MTVKPSSEVPVKRLSALAVVALIVVGCTVYVPHPYAAPMPEASAIDIAYRVSRDRGLNPTQTRYAVYNSRRGAWKVSLWLGPPSCGAVRMFVDGYNGSVYDFTPFLRACGGPPPVIEE